MPQYQDYSQKYNKIKRVFSLRLEARDLLGILDYMALRDLECRNVSQMVTSFIQSHLEEYRSEDIIPSYAGEANLDETLSEKMVLAGRLAQARQGKLKWNDIVSAQSSSASTSQREALNLALANQDFAPPNNWVPDIVNDGSPTEVMGNPTDFSAPSDDPNNLGIEEILARAPELTLNDLYPGQRSEFGFDDLDDLLQLQIAELQASEAQELMKKLTIGTVPTLSSPTREQSLPMLEERDERLIKDRLWKLLCKAENEAGKRALRIVYYNLPQEHWSSNKAEDLLRQITQSIGEQE